jgi:ribonuclease HII
MAGGDSRSRSAPSFALEKDAIKDGFSVIAGVDEAGRGPWAGPVVAAAVVLNAGNIPDGLNDSKKLSEARREALFEEIMARADVGVGIADAAQIDDMNIIRATLHAMAEAVERLASRPDLALIDGNRPPALSCTVRTVVKGDAKSLSIAAASVIAKVTRDRMMRALDEVHPGYDFARHKGYGTAVHQAALARLGPSPVHRRSFAPIRTLIETARR